MFSICRDPVVDCAGCARFGWSLIQSDAYLTRRALSCSDNHSSTSTRTKDFTHSYNHRLSDLPLPHASCMTVRWTNAILPPCPEKVRACIHLFGTVFAHSITFTIFFFVSSASLTFFLMPLEWINRVLPCGPAQYWWHCHHVHRPSDRIEGYGYSMVFVYPWKRCFDPWMGQLWRFPQLTPEVPSHFLIWEQFSEWSSYFCTTSPTDYTSFAWATTRTSSPTHSLALAATLISTVGFRGLSEETPSNYAPCNTYTQYNHVCPTTHHLL